MQGWIWLQARDLIHCWQISLFLGSRALLPTESTRVFGSHQNPSAVNASPRRHSSGYRIQPMITYHIATAFTFCNWTLYSPFDVSSYTFVRYSHAALAYWTMVVSLEMSHYTGVTKPIVKRKLFNLLDLNILLNIMFNTMTYKLVIQKDIQCNLSWQATP